MPETPELNREGDNQKVIERIEAILQEIAYGSLTLKIQNYKVVQIKREQTELID